jgi:hypothetical protein
MSDIVGVLIFIGILAIIVIGAIDIYNQFKKF